LPSDRTGPGGRIGRALRAPWRRPRPVGSLAAVGLVVALVYVVTLGVSLGLHPGHVRPLYEGFTPPSTYRWVNPPRALAAANQPPTVTHASIKMGPTGSVATGISTDDGQLVLGMAAGAVAVHAGDTSVAVTITPLDPATLPSTVPRPYRADGNVYDVAMVYRPSGTPVPQLSGAGASMVLITPSASDHLFTTRTDQGPWTSIPAHQVPPTDLTLGATVRAPGYYVGGTTLPAPAFGHGSSSDVLVVSLGVGMVAVLVIGGAFVLSRRRRRPPS